MKKFFSLVLCATALTTNPLLAMEKEDQPSGMKKINFVMRFEQDNCAPASVDAAITFKCGDKEFPLEIKGLENGFSRKTEVLLPSEGEKVKLSSQYTLRPLDEFKKDQRVHTRYRNKGIKQSSIPDGSTLTFSLNARGQMDKNRKLSSTVDEKFSTEADDNEQNYKVHITVVNNSNMYVACKKFFDPYNGQSQCVAYLEPKESVAYTTDTRVFRGPFAERDNAKYPLYFQFVKSDIYYGPSINMTKENDLKKFELYSLSKERDQVHAFGCREMIDQPLLTSQDKQEQTLGLKKVNLTVMFEGTFCSPNFMNAQLGYELFSEGDVKKGDLGFYDLLNGSLNKKEVFLPSEPGTIKFTYKGSLPRNMQAYSMNSHDQKYYFNGTFYEGERDNPIYDIKQSLISDGSTLELYIKALPTSFERKSLDTPVYDLNSRLTINK